MSDYRLPDGREVGLVRFAICGTYLGELEGTAMEASRSILADLPKEAKSLLPPGKPLFAVPCSKRPLPEWLCVAELQSSKGAKTDDPDFNSQLYVSWFTDDTSQSIDVMIEAILPDLDWNRYAKDVDSTYI